VSENLILPRVRMCAPTLASMTYVTNHLREIDRREVFAGAITHPDTLAIDAVSASGFIDVAWLDAMPVAAVGGRELWPGVWSVWCFGTDDWFKVKLAITRHIIRALVPSMLKAGGWRGQCLSHEDHVEAHDWLLWLGFEREAVLRQYGRDGSDFHMFAWRLSRLQDCKTRWWGRHRAAELTGGP